MEVVFYFAIGILLAFLLVFLNKVIDKHKGEKWINLISWMKFDKNDESGLSLACLLLVLIWPLILCFVGMGFCVLMGLGLFYFIGTGLYKAFTWVTNKILK